MVKKQKSKRNPHNVVFVEALVMALFIFGLGLMLGIFIEESRADSIESEYIKSQINLLDIQTLSGMMGNDDYSCEYRIEKNIEFGNRIYNDALLFAKYESVQTFGDKLVEQHRIYDLLRTIFWLNSIELRNDCPELQTIVYLYNYGTEDSAELQRQKVFSRFAGELKDEIGKNVVLIPIAINLNIASLDVLKDRYNITGGMILVNEEDQLTDIGGLDDFRKNVKS
jgi:hypothetical protein